MKPIENGGPWLGPLGRDADVVVASRVRLARNLAGFPFTNRASTAQRRDVVSMVRDRAQAASWGRMLGWVDLQGCPAEQRTQMVERHLVSKQFAASDAPRAVGISADETLSVMVNEEDHLRIQAMYSGLRIDECFAAATAFDQGAESALDYAWHHRWGYLTACPTNVGCGIRVSVMLHLPALRLTSELDRVRRAAKDLHLALRGFHGEGSEPMGDFYQLSNQITLGMRDEEVVGELRDRIIPQVIRYERLARETYRSKAPAAARDRFIRAAAMLTHARLMSLDEAMKLLGRLRLGIASGLTEAIDSTLVHRLLLQVQPAHLALVRPNDPMETLEQQSAARAALLRDALAPLRASIG